MDLCNQIPQLIAQKKFQEALPLLVAEFDRTFDVKTLRMILAVCAGCQNLEGLRRYNARLAELSPYDAGHYFFKGVLHELEGDFDSAIGEFKFAFHRMPSQKQAFERAWQLVQRLGLEAKYRKSADVVMFTGNFNLKPRFHPNTILTRGIGGSESAFIYMARELAGLGKTVLAFCNCDAPGLYDGVEYLPVEDFAFHHQINHYPLVVSARTPDGFLGDLHSGARHVLWLQDAAHTELYRDFNFADYRVDKIFVLSESHKRSWQTRFKLPDEKFFITKNGFDPALFYPQPNRERQIMFASRPERGLREAAKMIQKLRAGHPDIRLVACTYSHKDNIHEDPLIHDVRDVLGSDGVTFLGSLSKPDFAMELKKSLFLVHPNVCGDAETSCVAAIEAEASGVPVLCGRGGALAETVKNGVSGVVVDWDGDREKLVEGLCAAASRLLEDDQALQVLSQGAAKWAQKHYRWDLIARAWLEHWDQKPLAAQSFWE